MTDENRNQKTYVLLHRYRVRSINNSKLSILFAQLTSTNKKAIYIIKITLVL